MTHEERNQITPTESEPITTENNTTFGAPENKPKEETTMKSNSLTNVNTDSKEKLEVINNSTESASTKSKSQQSDKKKADAEKKKADAQQKAEDKKKAAAEKKEAKARQKAEDKEKAEAAKKAAADQQAIVDKIAVDGIIIEINRCLTQAKLYENQAEKFYFEMGKWLCEAKDKVKKLKGVKWLDWLQSNFQDNFDLTERTAQIRMKTYNAFADNPKALADLGYTKASILAPLSPDKREAFLSDQQHEVKEGVFKTVKEMTTRELEQVIQESKKGKPHPPQQKLSVDGFNKKLSSVGTQLNDLLNSLSSIEGDPNAYKKLYETFSEMLENSVSKLSEQPSELTQSKNLDSGNEPNPIEETEVA